MQHSPGFEIPPARKDGGLRFSSGPSPISANLFGSRS
jgi:hypothetical protein